MKRSLPAVLALLAGWALIPSASGAAAAPGWTPPIAALPSGVAFEHISGPAVDAVGDTYLAYTAESSGVWVVERTAGTTSFGPPLKIATSAPVGIPQIASDAAGDLVVAWMALYAHAGREDIVPFMATVSGGAVSFSGTPLSVPEETLKFDTNLAVASDPFGAAAVAWLAAGGQQLAQVVTRGSAAQGFGSLTNVGAVGPSGPTSENVTSLAMSVDGVGNVVLAYTQAGEMLELTGPQWPPTPSRLSGDTSSRSPAVASAGANTILAWVDESSHPYFINASLALGATPGNVLLSAPKILRGSYDAIGTPPPAVAIDPNGDAVVAWQESAVSNSVLRAAVRPAGGAFSLSELDVSDESTLDLGRVASMTPNGVALVGWLYDVENGPVNDAEARTISTSGALGPIAVLDTHDAYGSLSASASPDEAGEPVFSWEQRATGNVGVSAYDTVPPTLEAISGPASVSVGAGASFSVTAPFDIWSPPVFVSWSFGDGAGASGLSATHAYAAPGSYTITATATDTLGNASVQSAHIVVNAPPASGAGSPPAASGANSPHCAVPALERLSLRAAKSRLARAGCALGEVKRARHRPHGAKRLSYGVLGQSPAPGSLAPLGARVKLTLGWFKAPKHKAKHSESRHIHGKPPKYQWSVKQRCAECD
jgi:hypothetical protein